MDDHGGRRRAVRWARTVRALAARSVAVVATGTFAAFAACAGPTSTLANAGVTGSEETALGNFVLIVASAVVVIVVVFVLAAAFRRRMAHGVEAGIEPTRPAADRRSIVIFGIVLPTIVLAVAFVLTLRTLNAVAAPGRPYAANVTVTGHQWWWEIAYHDTEPSHTFTAANEIHLPVGQPVRFDVQTADVIHTLWVPELAGKIQLIPGQHNSLWLEARVPGVFSGPCSQYCGTQHAHMRITVVAEPASAYEQWLESQRQAAAVPSDSARAMGQRVFLSRGCASCHAIRGTDAGGAMGPDLTHLASRRTLGAGAIANTPDNLIAWIQDAQGIKPGVDMPRMSLQPGELQSLVAYLESLH
jgi:cytochrome c oxidase subunit 2